jgi:DNA repair protein RadA/Sms
VKKQRAFVFRCSACGREEPKWLGRCPECGEWNTLVETAPSRAAAVPGARGAREAGPESLPLSAVSPQEGNRLSTGIAELDRVLGGGVMKRSAVLAGGEPGVGKSTLLLQAAARAGTGGRVLYVSGEESAGQIRMRADRLGIGEAASRIEILCSGSLEDILKTIDKVKPLIVIIDSVQTLYTAEAGQGGLSLGSISQMRYCAWELISWVKEHDAALFLLAHVTKDGIIAGPKSLEHMVDTVLYFEGAVSTADGECRFLRAVKNRFGSVDEIGIFTMGERGLAAVEDPSLLFLVRREGDIPPGTATAAVLEGTRTLLVEIQALTVPAKGSMSRVFSDRIDSARVSRVAAAIEKYLGLRLSDQDLYVNVAGGIRITEVGAELALACAIYSARTGLPVPAKTAIAGELSLTGEVRPLRRLAARVRAAGSLGFGAFIGPAGGGGAAPGGGSAAAGAVPEEEGKPAGNIVFTGVKGIREAVKAIFAE